MADLQHAHGLIHPNKNYHSETIRQYRDGLRYTHCADNRELTRLHDDPCERMYRHHESTKPVKYITRNFRDLGLNPQSLCYVGFLAQDGFGTPCAGIDVDSHLRVERPLPRCKDPQQLDACPKPTRPFQGRGCGDPAIEVDIKAGLFLDKDKPCLPRETDFYNRSFEIFDGLCYDPQKVDTVVMADLVDTGCCGVMHNRLGGVDTRHNYDQEDIHGKGCIGFPVIPTKFQY